MRKNSYSFAAINLNPSCLNRYYQHSALKQEIKSTEMSGLNLKSLYRGRRSLSAWKKVNVQDSYHTSPNKYPFTAPKS
jgi:hypothetical protein